MTEAASLFILSASEGSTPCRADPSLRSRMTATLQIIGHWVILLLEMSAMTADELVALNEQIAGMARRLAARSGAGQSGQRDAARPLLAA